MWLHSLKVAQLLRSAACLHTNQSRSYLNHLVVNYCEGGEIENKDRKKERQNERKGELNNESEKRVLLNKTML